MFAYICYQNSNAVNTHTRTPKTLYCTVKKITYLDGLIRRLVMIKSLLEVGLIDVVRRRLLQLFDVSVEHLNDEVTWIVKPQRVNEIAVVSG